MNLNPLKPLAQTFIRAEIASGRGAKPTKDAVDLLNSKWMKYNKYFSLLAPVATGISNPILMDYKYRRSGMEPKQRRALISQEWANQLVTMVLHVGSFLTFSKLTVHYMNKQAVASTLGRALSNTQAAELIVGNIGGLFAYGVLRPLLGATLFKKFEKHQANKDQRALSSQPQNRATKPPEASPQAQPTFAAPPANINRIGHQAPQIAMSAIQRPAFQNAMPGANYPRAFYPMKLGN